MSIGTRLEHLARRVPYLRRPFYQRDQARSERDALALRLADFVPGVLAPANTGTLPDLRAELRSLAEWESLAAAHPAILDAAYSASIVAHGIKFGVQSRFLGFIPPRRVDLRGPFHREQFVAAGFNARQRALLDLLEDTVGDRTIYQVAIYAHEAMTPVALALRGRYPRVLGSEYAPTEAEQRRIYPVPSIDITRSALPDESFDIVLSGDVLEHVPDLDAALRDTARILAPGGKLLATVPFAYSQAETSIRARLAETGIEYLEPPEYHGNPMDNAKGSLVFQIPGWDMLRAAREAGFADAHMLFWSSAARGFTGGDLGGVFLLVAAK